MGDPKQPLKDVRYRVIHPQARGNFVCPLG
jgi:hypothetical protein